MTDATILRRGLGILALAARLQPRPFALGATGGLLYGATTVLSAAVLGRVTDEVLLPALESGVIAPTALTVGVVAVLVVGIVRALGIVARRYGAYLMQLRVQAAHRVAVTRRYVRLPLSWHVQHTTGELLSNANSDVEAAFMTVAAVPISLGVVLMLVIALPFILITDLALGVIGLTVIPGVAITNLLFQRRLEAAATAAQQFRAEVSGVAHESFEGALVTKTLGREAAETERFRVMSDDLRDRNIRLGALRAAFDPIIEALPNVGVLLVLLVGAWRVQSGAITPGDLVRVAYLFGLLAMPLRVIGWVLGDMPRSVVGWDRVSRVLEATGEMTYGERPAGGTVGASVRLEGVDFRYPATARIEHLGGPHVDPEQTRGLDRVDFDVRSGTTTALVGPTGSGKSTVASLLVRLYDPDAGVVVFDGAALPEVGRDALASDVAIVFQDSFLFDDTVRGNITLGGDFSDDEVRAAARLAQADSFITAMAQGYDTPVGERGSSLSGGQRQRVALARALVRQPRLLIMDDATSSCDPAIEAAILEGLATTDLVSTVVVVAYRRGTIALADEVLFIEHGRVSATGTHDHLLVTHEPYRNLVTAYDEPTEVAS